MRRTLLHIYGPLSIHSYGVAIAIGVVIFNYFITKNPQFKKLQLANCFTEILLLCVMVGLIGGRILYLLSEKRVFNSLTDILTFWNGGFSVLGTIIGILLVVPLYLKKQTIPIIPFLDLVALYAPLLQSISRIGCFFAGCCYGIPTSLPWGFSYTDPDTVAPLNCKLHPTQLYSSFILLCIFVFLYFIIQKYATRPGQLLCSYLMLVSTERFFIDFWRADRIYTSFSFFNILSINQLLACVIFTTALSAFLFSSFQHKKLTAAS